MNIALALFICLITGCRAKREASGVHRSYITSQTQPDTSANISLLAGMWKVVHQRSKMLSGHLCCENTYTVRIDSSGNIFRLETKGDETESRLGKIAPTTLRTHQLFIEGQSATFLYRADNKDHFKLVRNTDEIRERNPIADPEIYPDGRADPPTINCDTEVWRFYRIE